MRRFWARYWSKGTRQAAWDASATPYTILEQRSGAMGPTTSEVPTCAGCNKPMISLCHVNGMVFPLPPSPRCCGHEAGQLGSPATSDNSWASPRGMSRASISGFSDWSSLADRPSRAARLKPKLKKSMHGLRTKVGRLSI